MRAPPKDYPGTWEGLMELFEDITELEDVASDLKTILCKANLIQLVNYDYCCKLKFNDDYRCQTLTHCITALLELACL